jgi:hypothetical protein
MNEHTAEIIKRFENSWVEAENFYDDLIHNYSGSEEIKQIKNFISDHKNLGENKVFRIGTSIYILIISRSVNHGLEMGQKRIIIEPCDTKFKVTFSDGGKIFRQYLLDNLKDEKIIKLLKTLKATLVD